MKFDPTFEAAANAVEHAIVTHLADLGDDELPELQEMYERLMDYADMAENDPTWRMTVAELDAYEAEHGRE